MDEIFINILIGYFMSSFVIFPILAYFFNTSLPKIKFRFQNIIAWILGVGFFFGFGGVLILGIETWIFNQFSYELNFDGGYGVIILLLFVLPFSGVATSLIFNMFNGDLEY